jgi:hypothetical protein
MSYRGINRHDAWIRHREKSAAYLAAIGLPPAVYQTERALREFLTTSRREDLGLDLVALPEEQFWKLFHFATSTFDCDAADFTSLERRRLRGRPAAG